MECIECNNKFKMEEYNTEYNLCLKCYEVSYIVNRCTICKRDMGYNNPRQLCKKDHCEYELYY